LLFTLIFVSYFAVGNTVMFMAHLLTKDSSTVPSEIRYYVLYNLNRTIPEYLQFDLAYRILDSIVPDHFFGFKTCKQRTSRTI